MLRVSCFAILCAGAAGCSGASSTGSNTGSNADEWPPVWAGFTEIGSLGEGCTAALANEPATAMGPLTFIPCTSGGACEELKWDGAVHWAPGGGSDLLGFDVDFVRDENGSATRLLLRHHYPISDVSGPNPYEAVLYDLASGAPLAVVRNVGTREPSGPKSGSSTFGSGAACFVVPVASQHGLWIAGASGRSSSAAVAGYVALPGSDLPTMRDLRDDASFLSSRALAFDDHLLVSQSDGKIIVFHPDGSRVSTYGPGERVWPVGLLGDRFLLVNDAGAPPHYFSADRALEFVKYGGAQTLFSDGAHVGYWTSTTDGVEVWIVDAADGKSNPRRIAFYPNPAATTFGLPDKIGVAGAAMGDGAFVVLTYVDSFGGDSGPVTAHVIDLATGAEATGVVLAKPVLPGSSSAPQFLGYAQKYLWFGEDDFGGIGKILRVKAPG